MASIARFLDAHADPDWRVALKLHSIWIAAFWGGVGGILCILPVFLTTSNAPWLGSLIILMSVTFAVARFTKQPGAE